jgi:hypothetical protein
VGITSQYVEQIGRKLLGSLLGGIAGGIGRGIGRAATGMACSFATTYALGQLAERYYSGGRQMNPQLLREIYGSLLVRAKQLQNQHMDDIQQKARTLELRQVMSFTQDPDRLVTLVQEMSGASRCARSIHRTPDRFLDEQSSPHCRAHARYG